jgi:hypothetical protein
MSCEARDHGSESHLRGRTDVPLGELNRIADLLQGTEPILTDAQMRRTFFKTLSAQMRRAFFKTLSDNDQAFWDCQRNGNGPLQCTMQRVAAVHRTCQP